MGKKRRGVACPREKKYSLSSPSSSKRGKGERDIQYIYFSYHNDRLSVVPGRLIQRFRYSIPVPYATALFPMQRL